MSFGRANGRTPIRPTWVNSNDCFEYRSKQHGKYAFAHPAEGDPTFGRDPTDVFYEGVALRKWHGQQSVSGQDVGIERHHPPFVCAVTSPHMFATALLVTVKPDGDPRETQTAPVPCLLMPHRVVRGLEHDFSLLRDELDVVTRVVPPSTHSKPSKDEFYLTRLVVDPWRFFEYSPAPNPRAGETRHTKERLDYALVAVDERTLVPGIPREWLRSLEDAAEFGYHPAPNAHNLLGCAPTRWLDPAYAGHAGKNAVGVNWRRGRVRGDAQRLEPTPSSASGDVSGDVSGRDATGGEKGATETETNQNDRNDQNGRVLGVGFEAAFEGVPPAPACVGGAVLACMTDESARAAGARNSMAADTRFAASVRPFATPPIGYGDWGVLVGMHRGAVSGTTPGMSDVLRVADVVAHVKRKRGRGADGGGADDGGVAATAPPAPPAAPAAKQVSWLNGSETLEEAALRKRRQWVEGMTIQQ